MCYSRLLPAALRSLGWWVSLPVWPLSTKPRPAQQGRPPGRMLIRSSLIAGLALILVPAAMGGGPGDVYNDYAADGVLSCNHPRSDLENVLKDATLNQYGDPYTMA